MRAAPVGLNNAAFGAARGRRALEHSVAGVRESAIFRRLKALVFERFHGADSIGVALRGDLCGFHMVSKGVNCPRNLRSRPHRLAGKFTRSLR